MKKKQFVNYIHHSHTMRNEDHHIRLLEPLAKMRNLTKFIDKPICKDIRANNTAPSVNRYLGALMFGCEYCKKRTHRQVDEMPNGRLV